MLRGDEHGNALTALLKNDAHFGPFLGRPGKENGVDIECIAVAGNHLLSGMRGPVLRGWAAILEIALVDDEAGWMRLAPVEDLLILAGPTMDVDGPVYAYRWVDGAQPGSNACWLYRMGRASTIPQA